MALPMALPDPSNFLGVALVINRNREGPRFVFHYPSRIVPPQDEHHRKEFNNEHIDEDDIFVEAVATDITPAALGGSHDFTPNAAELARWYTDDHLVAEDGTHFVPWEHVAGMPTKALESILTPPRAFHKKRFQISLDSVTYISYPIHVPTSGVWARGRNKREKKDNGKVKAKAGAAAAAAAPEDGPASDGAATAAADPPPTPAPTATTTGDKDKEKEKEKDKEDKVSSMNMFSLVFVMSPKRHEAHELLDTIYRHIVREVNKVYKYCQESGDFVWQESKKMIQLKDRAREHKTKMSVLWKEILAVSSLAASMRDIYEAVCRNRIAVLDLTLAKGSVGHSVQVPMPFFVTDVQPQASEATRSLWLTTANNVSRHEMYGGVSAFEKCFALLLTDDDETKIVEELQARRDKAAAAMVELVKASKPTLSFYQVSQLPDTMLTLQQVCAYAQHFIYWRRAMAVPPIHARDVYVLSPNCDVSNMARATANFAEKFPFAPPLPDLLAGLSSAPRPYKSFCPNKSLRPAYLRILAWLIRGGWVCQLCTFAYVVVWPEIQYEVEYNLESEDLARIKQKQQRQKQRDSERDSSNSNNNGGGSLHGSRSSAGLSSSELYEERERQEQLKEAGQDLHASSLDSAGGGDDSDGGSNDGDVGEIGGMSEWSGTVSSMPSSSLRPDRDRAKHGGRSAAEHAAERARRQRMAEKAAHSLAERSTAHARKPVPKSTSHPSVNNAPHLAGILPYVILDASKPTGKESLYLSAIERNLRLRRMKPPPASKKETAAAAAAAAAAAKATITTTTTKPTTTTTTSASSSSTTTAAAAAAAAAAASTGRNSHHGHHSHKHGGSSSNHHHSHTSPANDETTAWNERVGDMWPVFWKHFNGRSALERIALLEDMKRKDVWNLLSSMSEHLLCVRHW